MAWKEFPHSLDPLLTYVANPSPPFFHCASVSLDMKSISKAQVYGRRFGPNDEIERNTQ